MLIQHNPVPALQPLNLLCSSDFSRQTTAYSASFPSISITLPTSIRLKSSLRISNSKQTGQGETQKSQIDIEDNDYNVYDVQEEEETPSQQRFRGKQDENDYDRDPEFGEIIGSFVDEPEKAKTRVEERIRRKRSKILHTKTGSGTPMKVSFNKFDFTNSFIWFEFYNAPLPNDISLICDMIRSWHIVGRLGGCNSMNMQLSQSPENKRPTYDAIQGANVTPTTFYNIGDFELQDNLGRIWVDIGTSELLVLDILINALTQISSDYVGIKQVVFGGSEFENWRENLMSEDAGCSVHKV